SPFSVGALLAHIRVAVIIQIGWHSRHTRYNMGHMCAYRGTAIGGWIEGIGPTRGVAGIAITKDKVVSLTARGQGRLILEERTCLVGTLIASTGNTGHGKGFVINVHQGRG